jgi:hypothetical protein
MEIEAQQNGEIQPLSLYIALQPDSRGDLEVISRAAIAWSQAIREAAFIVDPFLEIRVELVSGTEGSINLNSLIRALRGAASDPKKLKALALGIAGYFLAQGGGWVVGKGYDALWALVVSHVGQEAVQTMSEHEKREIEQIVTRIVDAKLPREKAAGVYAELAKDSAVTGVGVSLKPGAKPPFVVPRSEFAERSGVQSVVEEVVDRRTQTDALTLTLLAPVLSDGEYKWKFQLGSTTVWAIMDDPDFKARLQPGSNAAPRMVTGIRMNVDMETTQERKGGVWTTTVQRITKVHGMTEPQSQPSWLDAPIQNNQPD